MTKSTVRRLLAGALLVNIAAAGAAIIMRHDVAEARYRTHGEKYRAYLVQLALPPASRNDVPLLFNGMGTLIDPRWVVTAAHAADRFEQGKPNSLDLAHHVVFIKGRAYHVAKAFIHPGYAAKPGTETDPSDDIALLQLTSAVAPDNGKVACLYDGKDELNKVVTVAGTGMPGTGKTGVGSPDGVLRGATVRVDGVGPKRIWWKFRAPGDKLATPLEGISGPGDSGGPALLDIAGKVCVVGISSGQDTNGGAEGLYGVTEYYTRVSSHLDWIRQVMKDNPPAA